MKIFKMGNLKIRSNGKYYQLGYYEKSKWINVLQLGTPEQILEKLKGKEPTTPQSVPKA